MSTITHIFKYYNTHIILQLQIVYTLNHYNLTLSWPDSLGFFVGGISKEYSVGIYVKRKEEWMLLIGYAWN